MEHTEVDLLQKLAENIQTQLTASVEAQRKHWEAAWRALEEQCAELAGSTSARVDATIVAPILTHTAAQVAKFQNALQCTFASAFKNLHESLNRLSPRTRGALRALGEHGWYFDLDLPMDSLWELEEALLEGNVAGAEASLCEYFESELERIESSIVDRFPHRAQLISAAFLAHRRGEYVLSIPVLLAQTDGICKEVVKHYLFMKRDKKPQTAEYVEQVAADSLMSALLSPLAQTLPINASERELPPGSVALNRHEVLHGVSLDYGTATNSLKAVALINYVACILPKGTDEDA